MLGALEKSELAFLIFLGLSIEGFIVLTLSIACVTFESIVSWAISMRLGRRTACLKSCY